MNNLGSHSMDYHDETPMSPGEVANFIKNHMADCRQACESEQELWNADVRAMSLEEYKEFCNFAMDGRDPVPNDLIERFSRFVIPSGAQLKAAFPVGVRCCVAVIPVSPRGVRFEPHDLEQGYQVTTLIIEDGVTTRGFGSHPSHIFNALPKEIQADIADGGCSFVVPKYKYSDENSATEDDRNIIIALYDAALSNAQEIFSPLG